MKENDCKAIRREIEENDLGSELDSAVMDHLRGCSGCRAFYESDNKLRRTMAGLVPVEAPADFDFRVRARIANEQPSRNYFSIGNLSLANPSVAAVALVLLVGGMFVWTNFRTTKPANEVATGKAPDPTGPKMTEASQNTVPPGDLQRPSEAAVHSTTASNLTNSQNSKRVNVQFGGPKGNRRLASEELSNSGAAVFRKEDSAGDARAALSFPLQTLKVSVDDGSGVSRTISIPTVSFGSQRTVAGTASSFQPPARSDW
jgi:hypothetical protein